MFLVVSLLSNSSAFRIRYILTQKWEVNKLVLESIMNLFIQNLAIGSVVPHSIANVWEYRVNGLRNCKGLFTYFDRYSLHTKKKYSYSKWKALHFRLENKEHLNTINRLELIDLAKQINK